MASSPQSAVSTWSPRGLENQEQSFYEDCNTPLSPHLSSNFDAEEYSACMPVILHQGLLFKRGQGGLFHRSSWKIRHVILTSSTLRYYDANVRKGELDLTQCTSKSIQVIPRDALYKGKYATLWRFAVHTPKRRMLFSASTEEEMNTWLRQLYLAIALQHNDIAAIQRLQSNRARLPCASPLSSSRYSRHSELRSPRTSPRPGANGYAILLQAHRKCKKDIDAFANQICSKNFIAAPSNTPF